jgi:hypothetical protein
VNKWIKNIKNLIFIIKAILNINKILMILPVPRILVNQMGLESQNCVIDCLSQKTIKEYANLLRK